jgi:hypothetical protein
MSYNISGVSTTVPWNNFWLYRNIRSCWWIICDGLLQLLLIVDMQMFTRY